MGEFFKLVAELGFPIAEFDMAAAIGPTLATLFRAATGLFTVFTTEATGFATGFATEDAAFVNPFFNFFILNPIMLYYNSVIYFYKLKYIAYHYSSKNLNKYCIIKGMM